MSDGEAAGQATESRWLALTGFMGAGKTSVGRRVASRLAVPFVDADRAIEERCGMSIPDIFDQRGELWFRRTEESVIRDVLADPVTGVLALGGGAVESSRTREVLFRRAWVVWLSVPVEEAWRRVHTSDRPLARDRGRFERRAAAREPVYRETADLMVDSNGTADEVAARVAAWAAARRREAATR